MGEGRLGRERTGDDGAVAFSVSGVVAGAVRYASVEISGGFAEGLVFGVLASRAGLGAAESVLMSALVFSGATQFVVLGIWAAPLPVATILLTTLVVNLRYLPMGAALGPWFSGLSRTKAYGSLFFWPTRTGRWRWQSTPRGDATRLSCSAVAWSCTGHGLARP